MLRPVLRPSHDTVPSIKTLTPNAVLQGVEHSIDALVDEADGADLNADEFRVWDRGSNELMLHPRYGQLDEAWMIRAHGLFDDGQGLQSS